VSSTLQDAKVKQTLQRHFVSFSVDANKATPDVQALFDKAKGQLPFLVFVSNRGQVLEGSGGYLKAGEFQALLTKVLENKALALTKAQETNLAKQVDALAKLLDDKTYAKAGPAIAAINKIQGYSPTKDKYYDLLETAQADGDKALAEAFDKVKSDDYAEARKVLEKVGKELAGLPVADQAKSHADAAKLLEAAAQLIKDKKTNYKLQATQRFDSILQKYSDTPYASLALARKKELAGTK
jgi:hypothetical protein